MTANQVKIEVSGDVCPDDLMSVFVEKGYFHDTVGVYRAQFAYSTPGEAEFYAYICENSDMTFPELKELVKSCKEEFELIDLYYRTSPNNFIYMAKFLKENGYKFI